MGSERIGCVATGMGIDFDAVTQGTTEEAIDREANGFARQIPQGMFYARERAGKQRAAAIESMFIDGLPVVNNACGVFADEVRFNFADGCDNRVGTILKCRFA